MNSIYWRYRIYSLIYLYLLLLFFFSLPIILRCLRLYHTGWCTGLLFFLNMLCLLGLLLNSLLLCLWMFSYSCRICVYRLRNMFLLFLRIMDVRIEFGRHFLTNSSQNPFHNASSPFQLHFIWKDRLDSFSSHWLPSRIMSYFHGFHSLDYELYDLW